MLLRVAILRTCSSLKSSARKRKKRISFKSMDRKTNTAQTYSSNHRLTSHFLRCIHTSTRHTVGTTSMMSQQYSQKTQGAQGSYWIRTTLETLSSSHQELRCSRISRKLHLTHTLKHSMTHLMPRGTSFQKSKYQGWICSSQWSLKWLVGEVSSIVIQSRRLLPVRPQRAQ